MDYRRARRKEGLRFYQDRAVQEAAGPDKVFDFLSSGVPIRLCRREGGSLERLERSAVVERLEQFQRVGGGWGHKVTAGKILSAAVLRVRVHSS